MREKGFSPEPDENEAIQPPLNYGGEFMSGWLKRRKKNPETTESTEDDEETEKPKSRFSRLFAKLFPKIASREAIDGEHKHSRPLHELFMPPIVSAETPEHVNRPEAKEESVSSEKLFAIEKPEPTKAAPEISKTTPTIEAEDPAVLAIRHDESEQFRPAERTVFERRNEPRTVIREQVIERRVAEPLAVLEYFLRRRAVKNVERRVKKETANLEKRLRQSTESTERLQDLTQKSQEQLQELRSKRETSIEDRAIKTVERTEQMIERPQAIRIERSPIVERQEIRPESPESKVTPERKIAAQPERILEKVAEAAEKNAPIEKAYERRAEIKDEPTSFNPGNLGGGAVPIGAVLRQNAAQQMDAQGRKQLARVAAGAHQTNEKSIYKQAAVSGFWTALVILVIFAVAFLQS